MASTRRVSDRGVVREHLRKALRSARDGYSRAVGREASTGREMDAAFWYNVERDIVRALENFEAPARDARVSRRRDGRRA